MNFPDRRRATLPARFVSLYSLGVVVFFLMVCGSVAHAQSAALGGVVMDPSSAMIRNAQVTITNQRTSVSLHTKTNGSGLYSIPFIQPGLYTLSVEAPGFKTYERKGITIETAQTVAIDVRLQIGETSQAVTVDGSGTTINTTDASVSTVIDRQFVQDIPLNGRSFQSLMTMVPGVMVVPGASGSSQSGEFTVNGQRTEGNYFVVDGVSTNTGVRPGSTQGLGSGYAGGSAGETVLGTTQSMVSIDDLQEFRALTSTYSAEYGRTPGGQFTFETRSGTNDWHGSAFEYFRNDALDANNYFNKRTTPITPRQAERQSDFGGTFGGPIYIPHLYDGKSKTFFFFSYEGLQLRIPQAAAIFEVPSLSLRENAASQLQPFLNAFPLPNGSDLGNGLANYTAGYSAPSSMNSSSIRIDHHFGSRMQVFGRFSDVPSHLQNRSTSSAGSNLAALSTQSVNVKSLTLGATNTFTSKLTSDLRFNFTWNQSAATYALDNFGGATPLSPDVLDGILGYAQGHTFRFQLNFGLAPNINLTPATNDQHQVNVVETMNAAIGRHNLKWGLDYRRLLTIGSNPALWQQGNFSSSDQVIHNQPTAVAHLGVSQFAPIYTNFSAFVQDEWQATPRFNISLGLRWELNPPPTDANGNNPYALTGTDPNTVQLAPRNTPLWHTAYNNFAPRFGIAYRVHQLPGHETVLRAGAGLFYDMGNGPYASAGYAGAGLTSTATYASTAFPLTQQQVDSIPAPNANPPYTSTLYGYDPHLKLPYSWEWNGALEQAFGQQQTLTVTYVGSIGRRLLTPKAYYPTTAQNPYFGPNGAEFILTTNQSSASYNALQVQFDRKLSHGLQTLIAYTWAHALDDVTSNYNGFGLLRANSDNDVRNNFQVGVTYEVPGEYRNRIISQFLKGWNIDGRVSARSSIPVNVVGPYTYDSVAGWFVAYHPNRVAGQPLYLYGAQYPGGRVINYAAYSIATDGSGHNIEGNAGRNSARAFSAGQADLALHKEFAIRENMQLDFRTEAFNILNQGQMGAIRFSLSNGLGVFGYAYQTENYQLGGLNSLYQVGGPRSLQLAVKLHF